MPESGRKAGEYRRALVVDDDGPMARGFARDLERRGIVCRIAHTAREALALAGEGRIVGALVDVRLGEEDGIDDVAVPLQRLHPRADIRIISGAVDWQRDVARATDAGFSYVLKTGDQRFIETVAKIWAGEPERADPSAATLEAALEKLCEDAALTPRQVDAVREAARGLSYAEIGTALGVSKSAIDRLSLRVRKRTGKTLLEWAHAVAAGGRRRLRKPPGEPRR